MNVPNIEQIDLKQLRIRTYRACVRKENVKCTTSIQDTPLNASFDQILAKCQKLYIIAGHQLMKIEKGYNLKLEERDGYLYALASGDRLTATIASAYWNDIAGKCFELDCRRILIEKDFPESVGPTDMLHMADHVGALLPGRKVAFIDRHNHEEINELGKKLARNRDVVMQIFSNAADAEKWLLAN